MKTRIELLVVIVIIGILAAIALPSFLNQAAKARQSEAKSTVGSVNRAQQAYRVEYPTFAASFDDLEIGLSTSTENYTYLINSATQDNFIITTEASDIAVLKNYSGGVVVLNDGTTRVIMCETNEVNTEAAIPILNSDSDPSCSGNSSPL